MSRSARGTAADREPRPRDVPGHGVVENGAVENGAVENVVAESVVENVGNRPPAVVATRPGRLHPVVAVVALAAAVAAILAGLVFTKAAAPSLLFDPGPVVRWGLPVATLVGRVAAAVTIGVLVLTAVALPVQSPPRGVGRAAKTCAFAPGMRLVAGAAGLWTIATVVQTIFTYGQVSGTMLSDPTFGGQLVSFVVGTEPGRGLLVTAGTAALITLVAAGAGTIGTAGFLTLVGLVALMPPALAGHSAGLNDHETAVTSMWLHLLGTCVWAGGLVGLVLLRSSLRDRLSGAVRVYSTLAGWAFLLVGASGVINAWIRLPQLSDLASDYGLLVVLKVAALGVLGLAGVLQRRRTLPDLEAGVRGAFARLAAVEVVVMGAAVGIAGAMAASAPPGDRNPRLATLAESLTGHPLPPPLTPSRLLTVWQPDLLWVLVVCVGAVGYLSGVRRLRARGDRWPVGMTISWMIGLAGLLYVTSGAPMAYGRVLFSAHMASHMSLSMLVPIFLVLGAPVTLALRALTPRGDGSRGPREWILAVVESRYARALAFPPVAGFLFAGSLVFFYFSPMFELALRTHVGHELMHVHFLASGYLFAWVLIGLDPGPVRVGHPLRLITLLGAMAFHSFFGVSLLSARSVLAADFFGGLGRTWGPQLVPDQHLGAGIAWGIGDVPVLIMAVVLAVQWSRSDEREARRRDRAAELDGDAELTAYNAMLARMAVHDARSAEQEGRGEIRRPPPAVP